MLELWSLRLGMLDCGSDGVLACGLWSLSLGMVEFWSCQALCITLMCAMDCDIQAMQRIWRIMNISLTYMILNVVFEVFDHGLHLSKGIVVRRCLWHSLRQSGCQE